MAPTIQRLLHVLAASLVCGLEKTLNDIYDIDVSKWYGRTIYFLIVDRFAKEGVVKSPQCGVFTSKNYSGAFVSNWCGGTLKGLISKLDYIQDMGFDAIWITPVVKQVPWPSQYGGFGYDGYYAMDWNQIDPHFGTEQDVIDLGHQLRDRKMLFMMDSVVNHAGPMWKLEQIQQMPPPFNDPNGAAFNQYGRQPFESFVDYLQHPNLGTFPVRDEHGKVLYDCHWPGDFYCGYNEYVDQTAYRSFSDINQSYLPARDYLLSWVRSYVKKYNLDGMRLDTVVDVDQQFIGEFQQAAGVFILGEVMVPANLSYHGSFQNYVRGMTNMPIVYQWAKQIKRDFSRKFDEPEGFENDVWDVWQVYKTSFAHLQQTLEEQLRTYKDIHLLGNFVDSHDTNRFLFKHYGDVKMLTNALTFVFMWPGLPIVYQGTEDPRVSEVSSERASMWYMSDVYVPYDKSELYNYIAGLNKVRRQQGFGFGGRFARAPAKVLHADTKSMAFVRGDVLVAISNGKNDSSPFLCLNLFDLPEELRKGCDDGRGVKVVFGAAMEPVCRSYPTKQLCLGLDHAQSGIYAAAPLRQVHEAPADSLFALGCGAAIFVLIPVGFFMRGRSRRKGNDDESQDSEESG